MSFIPQDVLNLNYAQILLANATYSIPASTTGSVIALSSNVKNSNLISVSANNIVLQGGVDYFITSAIHYSCLNINYPGSTTLTISPRLGLYNVTDANFLTQKSTWTNGNINSGVSNPVGCHSSQLFCVIPSFVGSKTFQLRVSAMGTAAITMYIKQNSSDTAAPDSTLMIYHN